MNTLTTFALCVSALVLHADACAAKTFNLTIERNMSCSGGETIGSLSINGREVGRTMELPWKDDAQNMSRVMAGTYQAFIRQDGNKGWRIELQGVPNHEHVELHVGNFARDSTGCVLVGLDVSTLTDPKTGTTACAVVNSAGAIAAIQSAMQVASDNGVSSEQLNISVSISD